MRVDLDGESAGLDGLPRFQRAAFHTRRLFRLGFGLAGLGLLGFVLAMFAMLFSPASVWPAVLINNAAALWVLVAGVQSAYWIARWRAQTLAVSHGPVVIEPLLIDDAPESDEPPSWYDRILGGIRGSDVSLLAQVGLPTVWLGGWALLVLLVVKWGWNLSLIGSSLGSMGPIVGAVA